MNSYVAEINRALDAALEKNIQLEAALDHEKMCMASCLDDNKKWHGKCEKLVRMFHMVANDVHEAHPSSWAEGSPFMNAYMELSAETRKAIEESD